jgi:tRNA(Ile)-lysidine synthase
MLTKQKVKASLEAFHGLRADLDTLSQHLKLQTIRPLGVAVSGGSDSLALLIFLWFWGQRRLKIYCVDHGLNPLSDGWCQGVERLGANLGVPFQKLVWTGDKPKTGLPAAARKARHRLIAEAAAQDGIGVVAFGHTRNDLEEADIMRQNGSSVGKPRAWSPSPVWPQGRGLFIYRPLLGQGRQGLRDWLFALDIGYVDDPANMSDLFSRARARKLLSQTALPKIIPMLDSPPQALKSASSEVLGVLHRPEVYGKLGIIAFERGLLMCKRKPEVLRWLAAAMVCVGGGDKIPRHADIERLYDGLGMTQTTVMTLCGARLVAEENHIFINILHDKRQGASEVEVDANKPVVWGGRYLVTSPQPLIISPLGNHARASLSSADVQSLKLYRADLRPTLPVAQFLHEVGMPPHLVVKPFGSEATIYGVGLEALVMARFLAFTGAIECEPLS